MFAKLLAKLFGKKAPKPVNNVPVAQPQQKPLPQKSEPVSQQTLARQQQAKKAVDAEIANAHLMTEPADVMFYDYLLNISQSEQVSALEQDLLVSINEALEAPETVVKDFPKLPHSVNKLMGLLDSDDFDLQAFCSVVEKDPTVATQLIAVANSAQYNPSGNQISDIKRAFTLLGSQGVKQYVLLNFVKGLANVSQVYFKAFGEKIWVHCDETAVLCREIAAIRGLNQDTAFLIGLVHDIGKIFIFKLIVEAFKRAHPDEQLGSQVVKQLLQEKSMQLSILITQHWKMPQVIIDAIKDLAQQSSKPATSSYGFLLIDANFISEWQSLVNANMASEEAFELAKLRKPLASDVAPLIEATGASGRI